MKYIFISGICYVRLMATLRSSEGKFIILLDKVLK